MESPSYIPPLSSLPAYPSFSSLKSSTGRTLPHIPIHQQKPEHTPTTEGAERGGASRRTGAAILVEVAGSGLAYGRGLRLRGSPAAGLGRCRRCGSGSDSSSVPPSSHKGPSAAVPSPPRAAPAAVQPLRQGLRSGSNTPRPVYALCTCLPENMLQKPESGGLPVPQAKGEKDGGHDGEPQALTASQEEAPSPLLQESPKEDLRSVREEGSAEPALTRKGARALAARALARRTSHNLHNAVTTTTFILLIRQLKDRGLGNLPKIM